MGFEVFKRDREVVIARGLDVHYADVIRRVHLVMCSGSFRIKEKTRETENNEKKQKRGKAEEVVGFAWGAIVEVEPVRGLVARSG